MKASPWQLIRAHYRTFVRYPSGDRMIQDYMLFWGLPLVALVACLIFGVSLSKGGSAGLLTTTGLLSAFFFGVMIQIAERALDWAEHPPPPGSDTTWQARFLEEIAANAGYASLASVAAAVFFVLATLARGTALTIFSSIGLALGVHIVLLLLMVLTRVFALISQRLTDVSTGYGANVTPMKKSKAGNGS